MSALWNPITSTEQRRTLTRFTPGQSTTSGKTIAYAGANYNHVAKSRGTIGSLFDSEKVAYNADMQYRLNPTTSKRIKIGEGSGTTIEFNEKLFMSDQEGYVTIVNASAMEEKLRSVKQAHEYVSMLMEYMVYTDEIAAEAMGIDDSTYTDLFKAGSRSVNGQPMPDYMHGIESRASYVQSLPESSQLYIASLSKIRFIVSHLLPVFQKINTDAEAANI